MRTLIISSLWLLSSCVGAAKNPYLQRPGRLVPPFEEEDASARAIAAAPLNTTGSGFFDQLLDHHNPSKGTFKQKYWWNSEYYAGPGSPVGLIAPRLFLFSW
jgi:hypothetical protein